MKIRGVNRDLQETLDEAQEAGWVVTRTNGSHLKLTHPQFGFIYASFTPRCPHAHKNLLADLRRRAREYKQQGTTHHAS